jgi:hypothetical protein
MNDANAKRNPVYRNGGTSSSAFLMMTNVPLQINVIKSMNKSAL